MSKFPENKPEARSTAKADEPTKAKSATGKSTTPEKSTGKSTAAKTAGSEKTASPKKPGLSVVRFLIVVVVLIVGSGVAALMTSKQWWPRIEPYVGTWINPYLPGSDATDERLVALGTRLDAVETAASIAGLFSDGTWVSVGPPLSCSGPSNASIGDSLVPT